MSNTMSKLFEASRRLWIETQLVAPPWLQCTLIEPVYQARRVVRVVAKPYLKIYQWHGQTQGGPLSVSFGGGGDAKSFFQSLLFEEQPEEEELTQIPIWDLSRLADLPGDLVLIEADKRLVGRLARQAALVMPPRVQFMLDVRGEWREVELRISRSVRRHEFRLIRKYGYEYDVSHSDEAFDEFYTEMYAPTMAEKHGESTSLISREEAYLYFRHGVLLRVKRDAAWVSGGICQPQSDIVNFKLLGVRDADSQLIHEGAQAASYYAAVRWSNQEGFDAVNFEGCRSYLTSLFQYKRKWGTSVSIPAHQYQHMWLKIQRLTPAVRQLLIDNPCVIQDEGESLYALVFADDISSVTPEVEAKLDKQYMTPGLSGILIRSVNDIAAMAQVASSCSQS